jgi:hypothetical protein
MSLIAHVCRHEEDTHVACFCPCPAMGTTNCNSVGISQEQAKELSIRYARRLHVESVDTLLKATDILGARLYLDHQVLTERIAHHFVQVDAADRTATAPTLPVIGGTLGTSRLQLSKKIQRVWCARKAGFRYHICDAGGGSCAHSAGSLPTIDALRKVHSPRMLATSDQRDSRDAIERRSRLFARPRHSINKPAAAL